MSMELRELLELAAKAAGLDLARWDDEREEMNYQFRSPLTDGHFWNPRDDDGDALRLAAHLRIDLEFNDAASTALACAPGMQGCSESWEHDGDRAAAARLAITRSAADVGRSM